MSGRSFNSDLLVVDDSSSSTPKVKSIRKIGRMLNQDLFTVDDIPSSTPNRQIPLYESNSGYRKGKSSCWNCQSNEHSLMTCPEPRNPLIIEYNKMKFHGASFTSTDRYHGQQFAPIEVGKLSLTLRNALGLKDQQIPPFIDKMKEFGYPLGHLHAAIHRHIIKPHSISHDQSSNCELEEGEVIEDEDIKYDPDMFIKFPGFNSSLDEKEINEVNCTQSLQYMIDKLKSRGLIVTDNPVGPADNVNYYKTETQMESSELNESKLSDAHIDLSLPNKNDTSSTAALDIDYCNNSAEMSNHSLTDNGSLSTTGLDKTVGTPLLNTTMFNSKIPSREQFSKDICDVINFENLPNYTGTYKLVKSVINEQRNIIENKNDGL